jgi:hypothetical protein
VFEDVSDALKRVVSAAQRRKDEDAMEEIEGMSCNGIKQFWCRYMPGAEDGVAHPSDAPPRSPPRSRSAAAVMGAGVRVGGVVPVSGVASSSADNSILERKESGAGPRFSCAAERKRKGAAVHTSDQSDKQRMSERRTLQQRLTVVMDGLLLDGLMETCEKVDGARLRHCAMPQKKKNKFNCW